MPRSSLAGLSLFEGVTGRRPPEPWGLLRLVDPIRSGRLFWATVQHGQIVKVHGPASIRAGTALGNGSRAGKGWVVPAKASDSKEMAARLTELLEPVVRSEGLMLVELQWRSEGSGQVLRLYIDRPEGGVTLDECAEVNRQASDLLDVEDLIPGRYRLEVSSPGLTRRLRTRRDFEIFAGRPVRLIYLDQEGKSRTLRGVLKGCQGQDVLVEAEGVKRAIALDKVAKANLDLQA